MKWTNNSNCLHSRSYVCNSVEITFHGSITEKKNQSSWAFKVDFKAIPKFWLFLLIMWKLCSTLSAYIIVFLNQKTQKPIIKA